VALLAGSALHLGAQTGDKKSQLEAEKARLQKEISAANELLSKTRKDRDLTLGELRALEKKLKAREALIRNVQAQVRESESEIARLQNDIAEKDREIDQMMKEYAGMLRQAQQRGSTEQALRFILGAENLSMAIKRMNYLRQYTEFRKEKVEEIRLYQEAQAQRVAAVEVERNRQKELLGQELRQKQLLAQERAQQAKALSALKKKEGQISSSIGKKRQELAKLERQISAIIKEELRKQRDAAAGTTGSKSVGEGYSLTPEAAALAKDFAANRGRLPWPVERGVVTQTFGENAVPGATGVTIKNPGIDIGTPAKSTARAVFQGEVPSVVSVPGAG
jgi:septal ring factor EnvC (AmiA/AmiB activator)